MPTQSHPSRHAHILWGGRERQLLIELHSSFRFLPALLVLSAIGLALALIETDRQFGKELMHCNPRWFDNDPEGARSILQAIAGSMTAVAAVVLSSTIVALARASTQ